MDKATIAVNLSTKLQNFLRFYYKCQKPFFEFPPDNTINAWISDNINEIPNDVKQNFGVNTFKIEIPLLYGQDPDSKYYVNMVFMSMLQHRVHLIEKDYFNQRFEQASAERYGVDFTVINIMNELSYINLSSIIKTQQIDIANSDAFFLIKDIVLKNNKTEFERIAKRFQRWKTNERVRSWKKRHPQKAKKSKKNQKNIFEKMSV